MIDLVFGKVRGDTRTLGPYSMVVFDRIRLQADGQDIAAFQDEFNQWIVGDAQYARLDVSLAVDIQCQTDKGQPSRVFGPYLHFSVVDTILYVEQRVFAMFDRQTDDWYIHDDGRHYPKVIVRPVRPRS